VLFRSDGKEEEEEEEAAEDEASDDEKGAADGDPVDYTPMKVPALRELLRSRGLDIKGKKVELIARLRSDDEEEEV
jgi:hypothetical protein